MLVCRVQPVGFCFVTLESLFDVDGMGDVFVVNECREGLIIALYFRESVAEAELCNHAARPGVLLENRFRQLFTTLRAFKYR